jgi:molecular chaperone GrpE
MSEKEKEVKKIEEKKEAQTKEPVAEDLQKRVEELEKQKAEYLAGWQRERADFLNYKKEEMERVGGFMAYAGEEMITKMLPILDNFEIVEKNLSEETKKDANIQGLLLIKKQIQDFLKSLGAEEIKSVGEKFDPQIHETVEEVESKEKEPGTIVEEVQKGYKINGRLMRPARVKVTK